MAANSTGNVIRLQLGRADKGRCYVQVDTHDNIPRDRLFFIDKSNPNFKELYSLMLAAFFNNHPVQIRTTHDISSTEYAEIDYAFVER